MNLNRFLTITAIILATLLTALIVYGQPILPLASVAVAGDETPTAYTVTVSWPRTGVTNRVMLDGVQHAQTTNTSHTFSNLTASVPYTVFLIPSDQRIMFSVEPDVVRWTGKQEQTILLTTTNWFPVTMKPGTRLTGGSAFFRPVLTKQTEVVQWWSWGGQKGWQ